MDICHLMQDQALLRPLRRASRRGCVPFGMAVLGFYFLFSPAIGFSAAPPAPPKFEAGMSKKGRYAKEGYFVGGQKNISSARLFDIRRGPQPQGVERVVFDLDVAGTAEKKGKAPFFQVNLEGKQKRVVVSIWADVTYDLSMDRVKKAFAKSRFIDQVQVIPRVEDGLAMVELVLKPSKKSPQVEAFHLMHPARIILDFTANGEEM